MKQCPNCFEEVADDYLRCPNCNYNLPTSTETCSSCGKHTEETIWLENKEYCHDCTERKMDSIVITATNSIEGHKIIKYLGVDTAEVVLGTGIFSEYITDFQDFFGLRSTAFEIKLKKAKLLTIQKIKLAAAKKGANAIVAMDLDYTEFSGNRVGVIASGSLVVID